MNIKSISNKKRRRNINMNIFFNVAVEQRSWKKDWKAEFSESLNTFGQINAIP